MSKNLQVSKLSYLHLMRAIPCAYTSTCASSFMCVKNSICHFSLWHFFVCNIGMKKMKDRPETLSLMIA